MKKILIFLSVFILRTSFSQTIEVELVWGQIGVLDQYQERTLCLTIARVPQGQKLWGVVEDIRDCYHARLARQAQGRRVHLPLSSLRPYSAEIYLDDLQTLDSQLEFLFLDGE